MHIYTKGEKEVSETLIAIYHMLTMKKKKKKRKKR